MQTPIRQDSVFLLTLVDFLLQIIFFGLFSYALSIANEDSNWKMASAAFEKKFGGQNADEVIATVEKLPDEVSQIKEVLKNAEQIRKITKHFGVSDFTKLTDELTRMAPVKELRSANSLIEKVGNVQRANDAIDKYLKSGIGKPACLVTNDGKGRAKPLATVIGYEDHLEFQSETPELKAVLLNMNVSFAQVKSLPLFQFRQTFSRLGSLYRDCMYTFDLIEKTRYVEPRDAATAGWNVRVVPRRG